MLGLLLNLDGVVDLGTDSRSMVEVAYYTTWVHIVLNKRPQLAPSTATYLFRFPTFISLLFFNHPQPSLSCFQVQPSVIFILHIYAMSTVSSLRRLIRRFLAHQIDAQDMARILEVSKNPEPLAVTSLSLPEIQKVLGLTMVVDDELDFVTSIPVPQDLSMLAR